MNNKKTKQEERSYHRTELFRALIHQGYIDELSHGKNLSEMNLYLMNDKKEEVSRLKVKICPERSMVDGTSLLLKDLVHHGEVLEGGVLNHCDEESVYRGEVMLWIAIPHEKQEKYFVNIKNGSNEKE